MNINYQAPLVTDALVPDGKVASMKQFSTSRMAKLSTRVLLFMLLLIAAQLAHTANLLFKSNFGAGVSLVIPNGFYTNGAWQGLSGTDKETGYSWPIKVLGANFSGIQLITNDPVNSSTIGNYITNEIRQVTGPKGNLVNELFQNVKIKGDLGQADSQAPLLINRPWTIGDVKDLYISYWFKYESDFPSKLTREVPGAAWRQMFAFKTGGHLNVAGAGDYRISVTILKGLDGQLYWQTKGDNVAGAFPTRVDYWAIDNHTVAVPIDKWSKFEVYWHRSSGSDGRFWAAINGEVIADYHGSTMGDYNLPVTRIFPSNAYSGGYATVESHSTGLEIWDSFPCGDGVSCYNFDTTAPTAPTSLMYKISKYSTAAGVALSWKGSSDNVTVAGYNIYRNGTKIGATTTNTFNDVLSGSAKGILYSYIVKAFDAAENLSPESPVALVIY